MGVSFFSCDRCHNIFSDRSDQMVQCRDICERKWCRIECALEDGFDFGDNEEDPQSHNCNFCRQEDVEDSRLLEFLMKKHKLTREKLVDMYFNRKQPAKKQPEKKLVYVADDPRWTLKEWMDFVNEQIEKYGENAILFTDAGANNVSLVVQEKHET